MAKQFPDAAPGEFPDSQGGNSIADRLVGPLHFKWISGSSWVSGNTVPKAKFLLIDAGISNTSYVDLSDSISITFKSVATPIPLNRVVGEAVIDESTVGQAIYQWKSEDHAVVGVHNCQVEVIWSDNSVSTFPNHDGYASYEVEASL